MEILRTEKVEKNFGEFKALSDINISVDEAKIFGLLGPNGAGKTTLIRIINQITAPDKGKVYLFGEKLKPEHISLMGYLPEERGLYKKMKVGEQAIYFARLKGMKKADAEAELRKWFVKFQIQAWWYKKVEELSKGMQQKVQFITTIVHKPKLLIFDEPFSGFDPINTELLKKEILELKNNGTTIIFSTHNMESVEQICDNIALINNSRKILDGNVNDVKQKFKQNIYELSFDNSFDKLNASLSSIYEFVSVTQKEKETVVTVKLLNGATTNELLAKMSNFGNISSFKEVIPGMHEIFIKAVGLEENKN